MKYCDQPEYGIPREKHPYSAYGSHVDVASVRGVFNRGGAPISFDDITDGASNTLMVGEHSPRENISASAAQFYRFATGHWLSSNAGYGHGHTLVPINYRTNVQERCNNDQPGVAYLAEAPAPTTTDENLLKHSWQNYHLSWGFKSHHPGGANFLLADGSVHFIQQDINHQLYQFLGCRNDGQHYTLVSRELPPGP